jgi:hypothetical protein
MRKRLWAIQDLRGNYLHDPMSESGFTVMLFKTRRHALAWLEEPYSLQLFWRSKGVKVARVEVLLRDSP